MIAPDAKLVRRLRQRVRTAVSSNPRLRRDHRRAPRRWLRENLAPVLVGLAAPSLIILGSTGPHFQWIGLLLVAWTCFTAFVPFTHAVNGLGLNGGPRAQGSMSVFYVLPVTNEAVFDHQWRGIYSGPFLVVVDWLAYGLFNAWRDGSAAAWCSAPVFALAQWLCALALGANLARASQTTGWVRRLQALVLGVMLLGPFGIFISVPLHSPASAKPILAFLHRVTPAGWLLDAHANAAGGHAIGWAVGFVAIVAGWQWLQLGRRQLRHHFTLERIFGYEPTAEPAPGRRRGTRAEEDANEPETNPLTVPDVTPPVDQVALRAKLTEALDAPPGLALFQRGWVESVVTRALTTRQRVLVDFLQPQGLRTADGWKFALVALAAAQLLRLAGLDPAYIVMLTTIALTGLTLHLIGVNWSGFADAPAFQAGIGFSAFFPVGFWETARTVLTVCSTRSLAALPLLLLATRLGFTAVPVPWGQTVGLALRGLVLILALQPVALAGSLSKNTNDTSTRWWLTLLLVVGLPSGLLVAGGLGLGMFAAERPGVELLCAGGLLALTLGPMALYGWAWDRGVFDLMAKPRGR